MRHSAWMSTVAYYVGLGFLLTLPLREGWLYWLPVIALIQIVGGLTISAGYHRLFCHGAYRTSAGWHRLFAALGVFFMYGSPLQWTVTHAAHHKHSDTPLDPHNKGLKALLSKSYRDVPLELWKARRLLRTERRLHQLVDGWYVALWLGLFLTMLAISPTFVIMAYLPALGVAHLVGGLHNALSHDRVGARDLWFMELIAPAGGEWLHGTHHKKPGRYDLRTRWFHLDPGATVINWIKK